jgi:predicted metal-dependent HD superfamily phosphohydrolase
MDHDQLVAAYSAASRHYHNLQHIDDCLTALAAIPALNASDREILKLAIWWHDVVYDPTRSDNEELSAQLSEQHVPTEARSEVGRLIRLTKSHQVEPGDKLGAIMVSIDLSILGAEPQKYDAYAAAIRLEYAHVPDDDYRAGRSAVLRHFSQMPVIFPAPDFAARLDHMARENIARELTSLVSLAEVEPALRKTRV